MNKQKSMGNKGFSLVELIVVIAIMAVLIGVLSPQFVKYVEKAKEATDIQNLDSIVTVVQAYYAEQGIPDSGITITGTVDGSFTSSEAAAALTEGGCDNTKVKSSQWKITGDSTANALTAAIDKNGNVTYAGSATYYKATEQGDGFEANSDSDSSSDGGSQK